MPMQINLAKSAGFCFGVKRALDIALKTAGPRRDVYMLGDIVHNEDVVRMVNRAGVKKIEKLKLGKNKTLLIRAHGAPLATFVKARRLGFEVMDATCPMVKEIHKIAKGLEDKGYKIIVIGDKRHEEVLGIVGQLKNRAIIIDEIKNIPFEKIKKINRAGIVVQSTQNIEKALKIASLLKKYIKELEFCNTICRPTRIKQEEIKKMPLENDVMIIIGSKNSANTRRLYEISKSLNPHTYWVSSKTDLKPEWFKDAKNIGVTAGASTPDSTTREVINYIGGQDIHLTGAG